MTKPTLKIMSERPAISHEQAAELLFNCATMLQMSGANEYRIARYRQAALNMMRLGPVMLEMALEETEWPKLGLGKRLGGKIRELVRDGGMHFYVELKAQLPPAVEDLMNVAGIGPKLALRLYKELDVSNTMELAGAARRGEVAKLRGFGPKRQALYARLQGPIPTPPAAPQSSEPLRLAIWDEQSVQSAA